ncbi:MAG TPA: hypothetical protein VN326_18605, partial [Casimicrobiaceae bacterium]|nr:hypothetical protein [Casimicrobiaceae bacterium]
VAERSDGGKLRVTCPSWDDAIAIHLGESLALVNISAPMALCPSWDDAIAILRGECLALVSIDQQVHVLRAKAPLGSKSEMSTSCK